MRTASRAMRGLASALSDGIASTGPYASGEMLASFESEIRLYLSWYVTRPARAICTNCLFVYVEGL
jgi:hypothetical protein